MTNNTKILTFDQLPKGGFAGLIEKRFVINQQVFGRSNTIAFPGLGNFVYLADANFLPFGETHMHNHKEVDVISVIVKGELEHHGSLGHGEHLTAGTVQVQRAGAEGFSHNEVNPNNSENHMIQLWVLPDTPGSKADYKVYQAAPGELQHVYGGNTSQKTRFNSQISISVSNTLAEQKVTIAQEALLYLSAGKAEVNGQEIKPRSLVHCKKGITFKALTKGQAIFIYHTNTQDEA